MSSYTDIEFDTADFEGLDLRDDSAPTMPAPEDDPLTIIKELRKALAQVGSLCVSLDTALCRSMLAGLTVEHKANQLREDLEKHLADDTRHVQPEAAE